MNKLTKILIAAVAAVVVLAIVGSAVLLGVIAEVLGGY